jgi:stage V sporulation protein B
MALPLIANKLTLNLLQSIEAVQIPNMLIRSGMSQSQALSNYGVLTGMTLPLILFPSAITSSMSVLLLPYISEASAQKNDGKVKASIIRCVSFCLLLGSGFCILFLFGGPYLGRLLFDSELAGSYIQALSITCPLLYLSGILTSTLHGLGKALRAFIYNVLSLSLRLLFVFLLIPRIGMYGYLLGILVSEGLLVFLMLSGLKSYLRLPDRAGSIRGQARQLRRKSG